MPLDNQESTTFSQQYAVARGEWNERYGSYIARERWWRLIAMGLCATTIVSTACATWLASQSTVVPYAVEVDKFGASAAVRILPISPPPNANQIKYQLGEWIRATRTVFDDKVAQTELIMKAYAWTDAKSTANSQLNEWYKKRPFERSDDETVGVVVTNVLQEGSKDAWIVEWDENVYPKTGDFLRRKSWKASIRVRVSPPKDEETILKNANGLYVTWFSVSPRVTSPKGEKSE